MPEVSIVIPCFQRHERLSEMIAHVQTIVAAVGAEPDAFETLVVDDCSDPPLEVSPDGPTRVIRLDVNSGPAVARNTGVEAA